MHPLRAGRLRHYGRCPPPYQRWRRQFFLLIALLLIFLPAHTINTRESTTLPCPHRRTLEHPVRREALGKINVRGHRQKPRVRIRICGRKVRDVEGGESDECSDALEGISRGTLHGCCFRFGGESPRQTVVPGSENIVGVCCF